MRDSAITLQSLSGLIVSVFRLNGRIIEYGDLLVAPLGISSAHWQVLGAIDLAGEPLTAPQIARNMGITRQGAQKQLNHLMAKGLIEQLHNPRHARSYLYAHTVQGKKIFQKIQAIYENQLEIMTKGITRGDMDSASFLLNSVVSNIEKIVIHKNGRSVLLPKNKS